MPLVFCPECGHEISDAAVACPNCGRPLRSIPVVEEVIVQPPRPKDQDIPKWVYIPIAVIGGLALLLLFIVFLRNNEEPENVNVKVSANRRASETRETTTQTIPSTETGSVTAPSTSAVPPADSQTITVPGTSVTAPETRGTVALTARVASRTGQTRPVQNERFYLLDKDIESILFDAKIDPIEGNSLLNSFGLSVLYPNRFGDFNRRALAAIRSHIKHTATSDASGKAEFSGVEPDSYYLFGITHSGQGFAVWSSPVSIRAGINNLDLSPQPLTDISG